MILKSPTGRRAESDHKEGTRDLKSPTGHRVESDSQEGTSDLKSPTGHRVESDSQEGTSDHKRSAHRCRKISRAMMCTDGTCVRVWSWKILSGDRPAGGCDF